MADGSYAPVRCGASNRCAYCAWLIAVENTLVVGLDASEGEPPTVGVTLTTHRADFSLDRFRWATAKLFRWLRHDVGAGGLEYCGLMEWTTGKGGHGRLPHMHALVKGVGGGQALELKPLISEKWKGLTGGAWVVESRGLRSAGGAIAYMVGHHHKREQAPPEHLRGVKRMRPSRGYFADDETLRICERTGQRPIERRRKQARAVMREGAANASALRELASIECPPDRRDALLGALVEQMRDRPPPQLVRLAKRGTLIVDVATGEVVDEGAPSAP
jgi:hypothetical protein